MISARCKVGMMGIWIVGDIIISFREKIRVIDIIGSKTGISQFKVAIINQVSTNGIAGQINMLLLLPEWQSGWKYWGC